MLIKHLGKWFVVTGQTLAILENILYIKYCTINLNKKKIKRKR